jgi:hypothetical protein
MKKIIFTGILEWHPSLFSLRHLPAIGAGAPVRLIRLRSRIGLNFFHFLAPIN